MLQSSTTHPKFLLSPKTLKSLAQNYRVYAQQVALYSKKHPYNDESNPQYVLLSGNTRDYVIGGPYYADSFDMEMFAIDNNDELILYSLFMAEMLENE